MVENSERREVLSIGIDLGDRVSTFTALSSERQVLETGRVSTTRLAFQRSFARFSGCRVAIEAGAHSFWIHRVLSELGHEVSVVNPRRLKLLTQSLKKNDLNDSEILARVVVSDLELISPVCHRNIEKQKHRSLLRLRDAAVRARTKLVNCVRGVVKPFGLRIPACSAPSFHKRAAAYLPEEFMEIVGPLLGQIGTLTSTIVKYDRQISALLEDNYPLARRLLQVRGVGPITTLCFLATIDDPSRFPKSRMVGPYLGLTPRQRDSSDNEPQLRITKAGDSMLRRLLLQAAHYILGPFGEDCDLRRHGKAICARGGKNARKRAVVAVARKLAVLLHRLWVSGQTYEPLRQARRRSAIEVPA